MAVPTLLAIDASGDEPFMIVRSETVPGQVEATIAGQTVRVDPPQSLARANVRVQTTIVIDNSSPASEFLDAFIDAAVAYVDAAPGTEEISVWTTGGGARVRVGLNNEHERTLEILNNIETASGASSLYDGIRGAALDLEQSVSGATNLVVLAGSPDGGSTTDARVSRGAVQAVNAAAFAVAADETVRGPLSLLVSSTYGGGFATTSDLGEIAGYGSSVAKVVEGTWHVGFDSDVLADHNQIRVTIDGYVVDATYASGSVASGRGLEPVAPSSDGGIPGLGFLSGDTGRMVGLALGAVAAALGAYSVAMLLQKDESELHSVLSAYADPYSANQPDDGEESGISKNAFLKRAVEITEGLAERRGLLARLEGLLERADMPLRAGEALTAYAAIALASLVVAILFAPSLPVFLLLVALGAAGPAIAVRRKAAKRRKAFMAQLPDTLSLLSSTLKAGYSFLQGVEAVSQEVDDPMGGELRRIVTEAQLGRPLEDAMDASAERMDSPDFAWAVMAVKIQREVGGNLSELLLTVAETMTERERLRRDVAALTAEGKMSAIVLGALPILLGFAMWAINPDYIDTLFTDGLGKLLLVMSIVAALAGFGWMKKIINIDI